MTTGAVDRARIAALDSTLKERNEKLEKCTTALIEGLQPTVTFSTRQVQVSQPNHSSKPMLLRIEEKGTSDAEINSVGGQSTERHRTSPLTF